EGSRSRGLINQSDDRYLETQLNAQTLASLHSGGDTTLKGAQVNAQRIVLNSQGDLTIISQQDTEQYHNKQQSSGGRIGVAIGAQNPISLSLNASKLKADSHYQSVQEQSGLFAGTDGFDVQVVNHTDLQAGAIVSEADPENNRFSTDTLSHSTLKNNAKYDVESKSISFSTSGLDSVTKGFGGGASSDSGEAQSTTYAALSDGGITIRSNPNQNLDELKKSKEEAHRVLERIFSEEMVQRMQEEVEFAQLLSEEGPKAIGDYADSQLKAAIELRHRADSAESSERDALNAEADRIEANWKENGHLRIALHAFVGGLGNGLKGVVGAGITASAIPHIDGLLERSGVSGETRKAILIAASAGVGGLAGGQRGAFASMGQTVNNYLSHLEATRLNELKKHLLTCEADCNIDAVRAEIQVLEGLDRHRDEYARIVCALPTSAACGQVIGQMQAFREGYLAAGPLSMLSRQKTESTQLAEQLFTYRQRAANPEIYNTVKGIGTTIGAGVEGTLDLGLLAGNAALGDEQSQEMLVEIAAATKAFLAHPVDNTEKAIKTKLDEIDRLEKSGATDLAHQKRAELYASGAFTVTGAGALAITGGKVVIAGSKLAVSGTKALVNNVRKVAGSATDKLKDIEWQGFVGDTGGHIPGRKGADALIADGDFGPLNQEVKVVSERRVKVDIGNAKKGTPEYDLINNPEPNTIVELNGGTQFKTNSSGYVEEISFNPTLSKGVRDSRQTAVGKEGLNGDVGGHIQACRFGGTCDRFNLFPQNSNFNNSAYKAWENKIATHLKKGDDVGPIKVNFFRKNPTSARPDSLIVEYTINGLTKKVPFKNQHGG
ncbi:MAG: hemagglutinin repeat-containing protein, partial [Sedimenticola sp.]|nr:hemagglutinin repeat-containing protein [Sedimenticola sp.]